MNVSKVLASALLAAAGAKYSGGTLVFYSGAVPASPETGLAGNNTSLCTFVFQTPAFLSPTFASGNEQAATSFVSTTANPIATGTVTFARAYQADGTTALADYTVGTAATDIVIGSTGLQSGVPVAITSFLHELPAV